MAELRPDEKDKVSKMIKELLSNALNDNRKIDDIAKIASGDKELGKLAKEMADHFKPYHKAARGILDIVNAKK